MEAVDGLVSLLFCLTFCVSAEPHVQAKEFLKSGSQFPLHACRQRMELWFQPSVSATLKLIAVNGSILEIFRNKIVYITDQATNELIPFLTNAKLHDSGLYLCYEVGSVKLHSSIKVLVYCK